jgi:hypothetical protein
MRRLLSVAVLASGLAGLAACSNPVEQVRVVDHRPTLMIQGAPADSELLVDGLSMGSAARFGTQALAVENGTHLVQVRRAGSIIYSERVFVSGAGLKTLTLPSGG